MTTSNQAQNYAAAPPTTGTDALMVEEEEYERALSFLEAFHSRPVATIRSTELEVIVEMPGLVEDEDTFPQSNMGPLYENGEAESSRLESSRRRNGKSSCLQSLVDSFADEAPSCEHQDDTDAHMSYDESGAEPNLTHPLGAVHQDSYGHFLEDLRGDDRDPSLPGDRRHLIPPSVRHYGLVGGMRARFESPAVASYQCTRARRIPPRRPDDPRQQCRDDRAAAADARVSLYHASQSELPRAA